jgi:hypothetical protein
MRQHRLLELRDLLSMPEQERLHEAIGRYHRRARREGRAFREKAHTELEARLRQWREYLRDVKNGSGVAYYPTAVETRAMIRALVSQLRVNPYQLDDECRPRLPSWTASSAVIGSRVTLSGRSTGGPPTRKPSIGGCTGGRASAAADQDSISSQSWGATPGW